MQDTAVERFPIQARPHVHVPDSQLLHHRAGPEHRPGGGLLDIRAGRNYPIIY